MKAGAAVLQAERPDVFKSLHSQLSVPEPRNFPGASDASLARPDDIKFELCTYASQVEPGQTQLRSLKQRLMKGPLGELPDIDDWAMEEFFWHGVPGESWHPIDAFLEAHRQRFPPVAQQQLALWKEAELDIYQIGAGREGVVEIWRWDPVRQTDKGKTLKAICLGIGGVNTYRQALDKLMITYVAPWAPDQDLFCMMGYGVQFDTAHAPFWAQLLGLRHPDIAARPWPWKVNGSAAAEFARPWRQRDWQTWLLDRMQFPFRSIVKTPWQPEIEFCAVTRVLEQSSDLARTFGIYFDAQISDQSLVAGATTVIPTDVTSANFAALAEYRAFRAKVGKPPGVAGLPDFLLPDFLAFPP